MFCESYVLFAIGNIHQIWKVQYPECFIHGGIGGCTQSVVDSSTYVEIAAVILGMGLFGLLATSMGRKWGSKSTATFMFVGLIIMVSASGSTLNGMFAMFNVGLALFGIGTGGEYPLAATSSAERAAAGERKHLERRGRLMVLTFSCQGIGQVVNAAVIAVLLVITKTGDCLIPSHSSNITISITTTNATCSESGLNITWRVQYGLGLLIIVCMLFYRFFRLEESKIWEKRQLHIQRMKSTLRRQISANRYKVFFSATYATRLFGVSSCWFLWDVAFYGNRLFMGTIIKATLAGDPTLLQVLLATLYNALVGLSGYYAAAMWVDTIGRTRMQGMGFAIVSALFLTCAFNYEWLTKNENITTFQALYYLSSFFSQFGPNATTWLLPGELFPTDVRISAHATAAISGKTGALLAALLFSTGNKGLPVSAQVIFMASGFTCLFGWLITMIFVPDTTHMRLKEADREWDALLTEQPYEGPATCWENLSYFECWWFNVNSEHSVKNFPAAADRRSSGSIDEDGREEKSNEGGEEDGQIENRDGAGSLKNVTGRAV